MSETMLDKVALAILHAHCGGDNDISYALANDMDGFRDDARAALKALREITDEMVLASAKAAADQHYWKANAWERCVQEEFQEEWLNGARYGWKAAIDVALAS